MELIATLVKNVPQAKEILKDIPKKSIVLFPESVCLHPRTVQKFSKEKDLFILFDHDTRINGKDYITLTGFDKGKFKFIVRKFNLWTTDITDGYMPPPKPEPLVNVRHYKSSIVICYDICKIVNRGRILPLGRQIMQEKPVLFFFAANWEYNFGIPKAALTTLMKNVKSLKAAVFSCTRDYAVIYTRKEKNIITKKGWTSIEI